MYTQGRRKVPRSGAAIVSEPDPSQLSSSPSEGSGSETRAAIYRGRAAADKFSSARSAKNFLTYQFFTYEETALVASRYFEGHALTLCIYAVTV